MSLVELQKKIGLKADGVFGPETFNAAVVYFKITPIQGAHFFGQTHHETGGFKLFSENLNYGAAGLKKTFKKYFPDDATAKKYERKPEMIANRVYGGRMGNGPEATGDGYKFRGRGALQLTGKDNYKQFATFIGKGDLLTNPDLVASLYAFESAIFYFKRNALWPVCAKGVDDATIKQVSIAVNGGTIGLDDRIIQTKKFAKWIK